MAMRSISIRSAFLVALFCLAPVNSVAQPLTVTSVGDEGDRARGDGVCESGTAASSGPCTLRAAIEEANASPGPDTIQFGGTTTPMSIAVTRPLPTITKELTIDASAQLVAMQPGVPPLPGVVIQAAITATPAPSCPDFVETGWDLADDGVGVQVERAALHMVGVAVTGFRCHQVVLYRAHGSSLSSNLIGAAPNAPLPSPSLNGITVMVSDAVRIGGATRDDGNVVVGFSHVGVNIGGGGQNAEVRNNLIGTFDGMAPALTPGSTGGAEVGIALHAGPQAIIDGGEILRPPRVKLSDVTVADNVIGGLTGSGVFAEGYTERLHVERNNIGVTRDGDNLLGGSIVGSVVNLVGDAGIEVRAVEVDSWSRDTRVRDNVIGGFAIAGIRLHGRGVEGVEVLGNSIGTNLGGLDLRNQVGVLVTADANYNQMGAELKEWLIPGCPQTYCNRIAYNRVAGVWIGDGAPLVSPPTSSAGSGNTVRGNRIWANGGLGIDLGGLGPEANDADKSGFDRDTGPNDLVNPPVAVTAGRDPVTGKRTVSGLIMAADPSSLTIDIYKVPASEIVYERVLRTNSVYDATLQSWNYPPWSSTSHTGYPQPAEYVGKVAASDIDLRSRRFSFAYDDTSTATFVAVVTDTSGSSSEVSAGCVGIGLSAVAPTNPDFADQDADALCDEWEAFGLDVDRNGTDDADLKARGADFLQKDVFVEIDAIDLPPGVGLWLSYPYPNPAWPLAPQATGLNEVINAFAAAPSPKPGPIALHLPIEQPNGLVYDDMIPDPTGELSTLGFEPTTGTPVDDIRFGTDPNKLCGGWLGSAQDRDRKTDCVARRFATLATTRYVLFANRYANDPEASGMAAAIGSDVAAATLGAVYLDPGQVEIAGGAI
jgi:CSLREA domain-containing protein